MKNPPAQHATPTSILKPRRRLSLAWILPVAAIIVAQRNKPSARRN